MMFDMIKATEDLLRGRTPDVVNEILKNAGGPNRSSPTIEEYLPFLKQKIDDLEEQKMARKVAKGKGK